jgi:hypothetical protein
MTGEDALRRLAEESEALRAAGPGVDMALRAESPEDGLAQLEAIREEAQKRKRAVEAEVIRKKRVIEVQQERLKAELQAQMAEAERALAPLREVMAQLEEGIWTVGLYLGEKEKILTLRDGAPAPIDEPIHMRQLVLAMDEECAVAAEEGGIDALQIEEFDQWLLEDPAHLEQVLPEKKGVVALVPRWQAGKEYENPWMSQEVEKANKQTYFLLRNGDQLYRLWTEFNAGKRLLPTRDEFANLFWKRDHWDDEADPEREALKPGTREWETAAERAEAKERHYMRVALIFEGLIHRTTIWHPVPAGVSFLDPAAHEAGRVRFIMDAEEDRLLGTARQPWQEYIEERQAQLRAGMRVVIANNGLHAQRYALNSNFHGSRTGYCNPRLHPDSIEDLPEEGALLTIEDRDSSGELVIRFKRTKEVYDPGLWVESSTRPGWGHRGGYHVPKTRASARLRVGDWWVLPYDLCEEEELRAYLTARLDRKHYVRMFPVIKAALVAKTRERKEEEPFIEMLSGVLARENGGTVADALERLPELVRWYKLANRHHRALREDDRNAVRVIVAEDGRRLRTREANQAVIDDLRFIYEDAMYVGRQRGSGKYVILEPMADGDDVYARKVVYGVRAGATEDVDWWKPEPQVVNRWERLWASERWDAWNLGAVVADYLTGPELEDALRQIHEWAREHRCKSCGGKGYSVMWRRVDGKQEKQKDPCEDCGSSGKERTQLYAISYSREPREDVRPFFTLWGPGDRPDYRSMGGRAFWKRDSDGSVRVQLGTGMYSLTFNHIAQFKDGEYRALRNDPLWIDEDAVADLERKERKRRAEQERKQRRDAEVYPFTRYVERQREDAGRADHVAAFVREYEHPELYEGHMRAHPKEAYEHERLKGLHDVIRKALDEGVELAGKTVQDAWLAVVGEDAPAGEGGWLLTAPPEETPDPEPEEEPEGDWIEGDLDLDDDYLLTAGEEKDQ